MRKFVLAILLVVFAPPICTAAGTWSSASVSNEFGTRNYKLWTPTNYQPGNSIPLVLMLHGCSQNPDDFAAGTQMNWLADQYKFFAVYPEQPSSANGTSCWNWFLPEHQTRAAGEPALLAAIVAQVKSQNSVRPNRVFVAGMSAGAAMSVIMAATYPDVFAGVGASAGLEFRAANDLTSGLVAQQIGGPDPNQQGQLAFLQMGSRARKMPTIVFHGSLDPTVNNVNGTQIIAQWAQTNDLIDDQIDNNSVDQAADQTLSGTADAPNGLNFTRRIYNDANNRPLLEFWFVEMMRHSWSGGSSAGSYTEPRGPSASFEMARFFGLNAPATAAEADINGRIANRSGKGLNRVRVTLSGGDLTAPLIAQTNPFGYYRFRALPTGANYVLTVDSKQHTFAENSRAISLNGETTADFISEQ